MNTKFVLAIVAAALACLSVVAWAATAPQTRTGSGSIDGRTTLACGTSTMLFGGAVPPNGFMVQSTNGQPLIVNDNGPANFNEGFLLNSASGSLNNNVFITPSGYKPMGPVSLFCGGTGTVYVAARAW
jgi:hypothetical protein